MSLLLMRFNSLLIGLFLWICSSPLWAALPGDTTWEVRPANGSDNNGACYDTGGVGTDFSQQNAAQLSLTDLAQTLSSTTLTSATGGFTSTMVDNCIRISVAGTGPFTLGYYEITVFTDTNTVTIDRTACSTANCSGGTGAVGGAALSFEGPATNDLTDSLAAGHTVWVKNEAWNEAVTFTVAGTDAAPIVIEGYNTTRDDNPTGANRPLNNRAAAAGDGITTAANMIFRHLRVSNAGDDGFQGAHADIFINCQSSTNTGSGIEGAINAEIMILDSEFNGNTSRGIQADGTTGTDMRGFGIYTHDNTGAGIFGADNGDEINFGFVISEANAADGIQLATGTNAFLSHVVSDGNTGATTDGFQFGGTPSLLMVLNGVASNNGNYGFNTVTDGDSITPYYNDIFGNTTGARLNTPTGTGDITTNPSFTDRAGGDFTYASGSGNLGAGFPQTLQGATGDYQLNIGVDQDDVTAGGTTITGGWGF